MFKRLLVLKFLFLVVVLAGCSSAPKSISAPTSKGAHQTSIQSGEKVNLAASSSVKSKIYAQHSAWKGTKYKLGGLSKQGVDCSGMVYLTFKEKLGIELPRSTKLQSKVGREIKRKDLRAGDLVFFKTGVKVRHVGIYIEDGKFFHASTSKGVIISDLNGYYWKDKYWHSRRVE